MEERSQDAQERRGMRRLFGEFRWEKWLSMVVGVLCLFDAFETNMWNPRAVIRDGAFHSGLLFLVFFYLSEMRYRLFPDVRSN